MTKMPITTRKSAAKRATATAAARAPKARVAKAPQAAAKAARPQAAAKAKGRGAPAAKAVGKPARSRAGAAKPARGKEAAKAAARPARSGARAAKTAAKPGRPETGAAARPAQVTRLETLKASRPAHAPRPEDVRGTAPAKPSRAPRIAAAKATGPAPAPARTPVPEVEVAPPPRDATPPLDENAAETAAAPGLAAPAEAPATAPSLPEEPVVVEVPPAPKKRLAPRPPLEAWEPRPLPAPRFGRPEDPRLAAAIAARERWHGRSGRPALKSGTQAVAFARERRLVQLTEPTALPNLLDPIVGKACLPAERVEGPTAATYAGWRKEVEGANDLLELRLAFERPTLAQAELWPSIVAVATPLEEAARNGSLPLPREAEEALELLDRKGTVPVERLRSLLGLGPREMAFLKGQLEARFLVLARGDVDDDDGPIVVLESFGRWAARAVGPRRVETFQAYTMLFAAAIRSAVVLWPEEIATLFPWSAAERDAAVAACVGAGAVVTYDEGGSVAYVASPVPR